MSKKELDEVSLAIKTARAHEKIALANAQKKARAFIDELVAVEHEAVIEEVRRAMNSGMSARQIGLAYGSSDPYTAKKLILEAMAGHNPDTLNTHPEWKLSRNQDGTFSITAYGLGDGKMSGHGVFKIDSDGENFSLVDGDMFIQVQLYRLGYKDTVLEEANG